VPSPTAGVSPSLRCGEFWQFGECGEFEEIEESGSYGEITSGGRWEVEKRARWGQCIDIRVST